MRVVDAIAQWFEVAGFKHYFGYAGGSVWPFLDALTDKPKIEGIQAKHEYHAVHMADIYHRRQRPDRAGHRQRRGRACSTRSAPAPAPCTNSSPVLIIAGGGTTHFLGKAGMQEIFYHGFEDALSIFSPVSKGTWMLVRPDTMIEILNYRAEDRDCPAGPGRCSSSCRTTSSSPRSKARSKRRGARSPQRNRPRADQDSVERVARMIAEAERPMLLAGGGVVRAGAADALRAVAEKLYIPVVTTLPAKGYFRRTIRCRSARSAVRASYARRAPAARPI